MKSRTKKEKAPKRATKKTPTKKTAAKRKASPNKPKLEELNQTNGKLYEEDAEVAKVRKLEEILEVRKTNPYGTNDLRIFEANVASMNLTDLQSMAVRIGVFPSGNTTVLKNKLIKSFKAENHGRSELIVDKGPPVTLDPNNPKHKKVLDYLNG